VTFAEAGCYTFQVTVTDTGCLTATDLVDVTVNQTLSSIVLSPTSATVNISATQEFTATARDQFATSLTTQPAFTWSVSGGGTIDASGLFTAGTTEGGPYTVTATSDTVSGTASVTTTSPTAVGLLSFTATRVGGAVTLTWKTVTELDGLGFNLYRAMSRLGRRVQLNEELIASQVRPGSTCGSSYSYRDSPVQPGMRYYYWLEAVDIYGHTKVYGPVSAMPLALP
jgi:hypothetical protein